MGGHRAAQHRGKTSKAVPPSAAQPSTAQHVSIGFFGVAWQTARTRAPGSWRLRDAAACVLPVCSCLQHGCEDSGVDAGLGADRSERMIGQHARGRLGVHQDRHGDLVAVHEGRGWLAGSRVHTRSHCRHRACAEEGAEEEEEQRHRSTRSRRTLTAAASAAAAAPQAHCRRANERSRQLDGGPLDLAGGCRFACSRSPHSQPWMSSASQCWPLDAQSVPPSVRPLIHPRHRAGREVGGGGRRIEQRSADKHRQSAVGVAGGSEGRTTTLAVCSVCVAVWVCVCVWVWMRSHRGCVRLRAVCGYATSAGLQCGRLSRTWRVGWGDERMHGAIPLSIQLNFQ